MCFLASMLHDCDVREDARRSGRGGVLQRRIAGGESSLAGADVLTRAGAVFFGYSFAG